jgi:hypothetical protein
MTQYWIEYQHKSGKWTRDLHSFYTNEQTARQKALILALNFKTKTRVVMGNDVIVTEFNEKGE